MIATILGKSPGFAAVRYNTDKMDRGKGELMLVANFGPWQGQENVRPEDYRGYLQMLSARNKRVKEPQFHAAISAEGGSYGKHELTEIAVRWMAAMGYGGHPFLVIFHNDTNNHHVHVVSTRIGRDGKKINSGFEHYRATRHINKVMGLDEKQSTKAAIEKALGYGFSTKAQLMMILESQGFVLREAGDVLEVIKFGQKLDKIPLALISEKIKHYQQDSARQMQLKAFLHKYGRIYDTTLKPVTTSLPGGFNKATSLYTSELAAFLKTDMGIQLQFHAGEGKSPYGYTLIDHAGKTVWKGGEIIPLKELLALDGREVYSGHQPELQIPAPLETPEAGQENKDYYATLLKAALNNYPNLAHGLQHQGLGIGGTEEEPLLVDPPAGAAIPVDQLLYGKDLENFREQHCPGEPIPGIAIAGDVDDEKVHGRYRKRGKKAR